MEYILSCQKKNNSMMLSDRLDEKDLKEHDYVFTQQKRLEQQSIPAKFPAKEQSLLQMFDAELFTTEYLIEYLRKRYEQPIVHEYLVNKLYAIPHFEMDFYITFIM